MVLLWGEAGDPVVGFRHLKQPMDEIGPFNLIHDHENGTTEAMNSVDLLQLVRSAGPEGLTALTAAEHIFEVKKPTRAQKEKARRRLDRLCDEERLTHVEPTVKGAAAAYFLAAKEAS